MTKFDHSRHTALEAYQTFFEALKSSRINRICYEAWQFFRVPVLITDENYTLLCCYPQEPIGIDIWDTLLTRKALPKETIQAYQKTYLNDQAQAHYVPFYAKAGLVEACPRIFGEIFTPDRIIGHVALFMFDEPLFDTDLECVQIFIDALNMLMNSHTQNIRNTNENYLITLLKDKSTPELRFVARNSLKDRIPGNYALMVTKISVSAADAAFKTMITSYIPSTFNATVSVIYENTVVSLFGRVSGTAFTKKEKAFFSKVSAFIETTHLPSGISEPFSDLDEIRTRFKQALLTADTSQGSLIYFHEVYPEPIFRAAASYTDMSYYIHPAVRVIKDYDKRNGSAYLETLKVYTLLFHDKDAAAAKLCIHRNTLHYRLERIRELFGLDLNDTDTAIGLLNSFQLEKVIEP